MPEQKTSFVRKNRVALVGAALGILVLAIYFRVVHYDFISLDDNLYVYENAPLLGGLSAAAFKFAFTEFYSANWHPLTWISHAADIQFFGLDAGAHHAVNVLFHFVNSVAAFFVFRRFTGRFWESAVIAALFAVHPAHVESVAWISERKDVLSTMFWLFSMLAYARYVDSERPAGHFENFTSERYLVLAALFVCGLMAKPMLVTFPFVLLLLDFWPLERLKSWSDLPRLAAEKTPLFVLAFASAVVTFFAQKSEGAVESLSAVPLLSRFASSITAYASYIVTAVYPRNLAVLYPWRDVSLGETAASIVLLATITAACIWQYRSRKYLLFGWLWFLGTLVPVIGLVQVGPQSMADRYTYVPYFGLFTMAVFGVSEALSGLRSRQMAASIVAGVVILIFGLLAFIQVGYWSDSETLYRHTLAVTRDNFVISHNLCHALTFLDRLDEARPLCEDAIRIKPTDPLAFNTLGIINFKRGEYADAETNFKKSIDLGSKYPLTYSNLALAKILQGRPEEGEADLKKAADITSGAVSPQFFANAVGDLANAYAAKKNYQKAAENFGRLVYIQPNNADARTRLAWSLYYLKKYDEAGTQAEKALSLAPDSADTYNIFGLILLAKGQPRDAEKAFGRALQISPGLTAAKDNLALAKSQ